MMDNQAFRFDPIFLKRLLRGAPSRQSQLRVVRFPEAVTDNEFVAMESTGPYWKAEFNVLEDGFTLILANARHIKNVSGRKADVQDSEWIH